MNIQPSVQFGKLTIREKSIKNLSETPEDAQYMLKEAKRARECFKQGFQNLELLGLDVEVGLEKHPRFIDPLSFEERKKLLESSFRASKEPDSVERVLSGIKDDQELAKKEPFGVAVVAKVIDRNLKQAIAVWVRPEKYDNMFSVIRDIQGEALGLVDLLSKKILVHPLSKEEIKNVPLTRGGVIGIGEERV